MATRGAPWFVSGFSTAQGVIVEYGASTNPGFGGDFGSVRRKYNLRGYSVAGSTAVAVSTLVIALRYGPSSDATLTTLALCKEPGNVMVGMIGIEGISAEFLSIHTSVAHADSGLVITMFGD